MRSEYFVVYVCGHCDKQLTRDQNYYSNGMCTLCGYKSPTSHTVVYTKELPAYYLYPDNYAWYKPWTWFKRRLVIENPEERI